MTTEISWKQIVEEAKKHEKDKEKDTAYRFSNGREFKRPVDPYSWAK